MNKDLENEEQRVFEEWFRNTNPPTEIVSRYTVSG